MATWVPRYDSVVINSKIRVNAGINRTLNNSSQALIQLIYARLKWRKRQRSGDIGLGWRGSSYIVGLDWPVRGANSVSELVAYLTAALGRLARARLTVTVAIWQHQRQAQEQLETITKTPSLQYIYK